MPACRRLAINVFVLVSWLCISACEKETAPAPAGDVVAAVAGAGQEDVAGTTLADEFPSSLAFLPDGSIVFTQDNGQEVWRADTTGMILWRVRRLGEGPGEYRALQHLVPLPDSQIGVVDELRGRFQVWGAMVPGSGIPSCMQRRASVLQTLGESSATWAMVSCSHYGQTMRWRGQLIRSAWTPPSRRDLCLASSDVVWPSRELKLSRRPACSRSTRRCTPPPSQSATRVCSTLRATACGCGTGCGASSNSGLSIRRWKWPSRCGLRTVWHSSCVTLDAGKQLSRSWRSIAPRHRVR